MLWYPSFREHIRVWRSLVSRLNGVQEAASSNLVTRTRKYRKTYVLRYFSFVSLRNYTGMNRTKPVYFGLLHTLLHTISRGQTGTDRISRLLQQPRDQGKAKRLAACNSQTASPFGCLNNFYFKILYNFLGSLQEPCAETAIYRFFRISSYHAALTAS